MHSGKALSSTPLGSPACERVWGGFRFSKLDWSREGTPVLPQGSMLSWRGTWEGAGGSKVGSGHFVSSLPSPPLAGVLPALGGGRVDAVEASRWPFSIVKALRPCAGGQGTSHARPGPESVLDGGASGGLCQLRAAVPGFVLREASPRRFLALRGAPCEGRGHQPASGPGQRHSGRAQAGPGGRHSLAGPGGQTRCPVVPSCGPGGQASPVIGAARKKQTNRRQDSKSQDFSRKGAGRGGEAWVPLGP